MDHDDELTKAILKRTSGPACGAAEERLGPFVDDALAGADAELVRLHLEHCAGCWALARAMAWAGRELPALTEIDPGPFFLSRVLAATSRRPRPAGLAAPLPGYVATLPGFVATLRERAARLVLRPRFALEAAYAGALALYLLFFAPIAPWRVEAERALALARVNPVAALESPSGQPPEWLAAPVTAGRRVLAEKSEPVLAKTRAARAEWAGRQRRAAEIWPTVRERGGQVLDAAAKGELSESAARLRDVGAQLQTIWKVLFAPRRAASPATQEA